MRIRTRLLIGLLAIVCLMVVASAVVIWQQSIMNRAFEFVERLDTVDRFLLECRRQEKNYLLRQDRESEVFHAANFDSLFHSTLDLRAQVSDATLLEHLNLLAQKETEYAEAFRVLKEQMAGVGTREERERLAGATVARARECHAVVQEVTAAAAARFAAASSTTHRVSVVSVVVAVLFSVLISAVLTRSIVGPLEHLRKLAERVSTGDVQDMDVEFSDLEMKRFDSRETLGLARSLQRMVTNLRLLVSSERGLMDDYHMTIVVLTNKAVGPGGWAVVERARSAAEFGSFADVSPSNVDRFLTELEREVAEQIPGEKVRMLVDAIRELQA